MTLSTLLALPVVLPLLGAAVALILRPVLTDLDQAVETETDIPHLTEGHPA